MQRWSNHLAETLRTLMRRGGLLVLGALIAVMVTLSPVMSRSANAQLTDLMSLGGSFTNGLSSCAIETVGWVICPTMRSIAKLADYGFTYVNQSFLKIDYVIAANDSGTYKAWELMRTIANALFVVAFMVIIYSQITGRNSGGYNIKRILPRLIFAAIAVNISWYICVIIIDIINVLGDSILAIFREVAGRVGKTIMPIETAPAAFQDGPLTVITSSVLSKTGTAWVLLAPVAAVIISIATISAAALVLLIMRKTVIAMLILASPILFVAYLLPNLEKYFFQGTRLFFQLLLLYPIIALLLGAGQIVSSTIVSVGSNDANYRVSGDSYFSRSGGSGSAITDLTACAAAVLPLLGVWFIFKNMSSIMSTAGARLSASVRSRRGDGSEKAQVTGKATLGAANAKTPTGIGNGIPNRRQAFSRKRRSASLGGSALTGDGDSPSSRAGLANRKTAGEEAARNALGDDNPSLSENAEKRLEETQGAGAMTIDASDPKGMKETLATAVLGAKGRGEDKKEKGITAKDIFNNMNQSHKSKDSDRKFGAGPGPAGGGGGGGGTAGSAQPTAPSASYRAPEIAQTGNSNIVSGSAAGQAPVQIVAVPVQVDVSSLLGQNHSPSVSTPAGMGQPPVTGTGEKAKARAQKYLFDAEKDLEEDRNKQDILGHKDNEAPTEQPHVTAGHAKDDNE